MGNAVSMVFVRTHRLSDARCCESCVFLLLRPRLGLILISEGDLSMNVCSGVSYPQIALHCSSVMC